MRSFIQLVTNEWLKLAKKRSFIVAYALMTLLVAGSAIVIWNFAGDEFRYLNEFVTGMLSPVGIGGMFTVISLISIAGIISQEHQLGTIKLLLIRSHSRMKILASKYVTMLLYIGILMLYTAVAAIITGLILFGGAGELALASIAKAAGFQLLYTAIYATIVFMFGVLTKSTGATVGIGLLLVFVEGLAQMLLSRYDFSKYLLFFNTDLSVYNQGGAPIEGMTIGFSGIMIAAYMAVFIAISFIVFKKRDVA